MVDSSRRGLIVGGLAALGASFLPKAAAAEGPKHVEKLYLTATTNAFKSSFGEKLSAQSIKDAAIAAAGGKDKFDNLSEVVRDKALSAAFDKVFNENVNAYSKAVKSELVKYIKELPRGAATQLVTDIYKNPLEARQGNLWDAMNDDRIRYPGKQSAGTTNPLFAAIDKLREGHIISESQAFVSIGKAGNLTVGIKSHGSPDPSSYNSQQTEELKTFHKQLGVEINRVLTAPIKKQSIGDRPLKI